MNKTSNSKNNSRKGKKTKNDNASADVTGRSCIDKRNDKRRTNKRNKRTDSKLSGGRKLKARFKAVLFDLDNTLIDYISMKKISMDAALDAMIDAGLKVPKRDSKKILYTLYDEYGMDYNYIFEKFLKKILGYINWKILASAIIAYRKVRGGFLRPYPLVEPTLLKLREKGIKLGVVTDAPPLKAWMRLVAMGIDDFFDIVVCRTGDRIKPDKLPFKRALKSLHLAPCDVLMVGDNIKRDIAGGKNMGMKTCLALYGFRKDYGDGLASADYEIKRFDELTSIIFPQS